MTDPINSIARSVESDGEDDSGISWFRASTSELDRHGTIVEPDGIDTKNFSNNPIFMWGHDAYGSGDKTPDLENVLGRVVDFKKSNDSFDVGVEWAKHERAVMARDLVKAGFLSGVSVGFIPDPEGMTTRSVEGSEVPVYTRTELVEVSLVPVPSNPNAIAIMRSLKLPIFSQPSPSDKDVDSEGLRDKTRAMLLLERFQSDIRLNS
tara:strand:+ start:55 stop:675 length:621 start_codon:yes stop_codon:yes gene_type:complete